MKRLLLLASLLCLGGSTVIFAQGVRTGYGGSPTSILDVVVGEANEDQEIQRTQLDGVTSIDASVSGNPKYRITNTLTYFKNHIYIYIQWIVYIGLTAGTILLIYNGFLLVTNGANGGAGEMSKIKGNLVSIGIGVVILTGFYFLIDLVVAVLNALFD
jgi:hypothetical protein